VRKIKRKKSNLYRNRKRGHTEAPFFVFLLVFLIFNLLQAEEAIVVKVVKVEGKVELLLPGEKDWKECRKGDILSPGSEIKTGKNSRAVIKFADFGVTTLFANSKMKLKSSSLKENKYKASVFFSAGKIWTIIKKPFVKETNFILETPNALTGVRGTIYFVQYIPQNEFTRVGVIEGEVGVKGRGKIPGYVLVKSMMATNIVRNEPPTSLEKLRESEIKEWQKWKEDLQKAVPLWASGIVGAMAGMDESRRVEAAMTVKKISMAKRGGKKARKDFWVFEAAIKQFFKDAGRIPTRKEGLKVLLENEGIEGWNGPYLDPSSNLLDPYGHPYQYRVKKTPRGSQYIEIRSVGVDGIAGSSDDHIKLIFLKKLRAK